MHTFVRQLAIYLYERKTGRKMMARFKELNRTQWWSREQLLALQRQKLYRMLAYAYEFVPYYRRCFEQSGFCPDEILTDVSALQKLPLMSKAVVNENFDDLVTTDHALRARLSRNSTGGSTGAPMNFMQDTNYRDHVTADYHRHMQWAGWKFGECHAYLWGADYEVASQRALRTRLMDWALNRFLSNAFSLSDESMTAFVRLARKRRPTLLYGYASALERFANFARERRITDLRFPGILSSAEVLYPQQRELIECAFGGRILDRYASRELGGLGCECPRLPGVMHISVENCYLEVLHNGLPAAPGEPGEIVVTNLNNYGMPLIRYSVGDVGELSDAVCSCGRGLPMMKVVQGRVTDMFRTRAGREVHGEFFTHLFYGMREVKQFQVVQKTYDHIIVSIVENTLLPRERLAFLERAIKSVMSADVHVEFRFINQIPLKASGKYRFTISEVK
jgi:phenylacetate-CoA ligase